MVDCFVYESQQKTSHICPIALVQLNDYEKWLAAQNDYTKNWLHTLQFSPAEDRLSVIPNAQGEIARVLVVLTDQSIWSVGQLSLTLVPEVYQFENIDPETYAQFAIAYGLGAYQFTRYKKATRTPAKLFIPKMYEQQVKTCVESLYLVRDLINTPTDDMGPTQLAAAAKHLAQEFAATFSEVIGEQLLKENYPGIYTVGRASDDAPRLLDLQWGNPKHPKVTLVGKGVCFDTGGLDLKPSAYMLLMKKDMAGGAHALGLARMIMANQLPVCLRVLIPAVENAVSGNAYRPGDIIKSRKGLTIEIGNTDAEGRVVLADALTEAVSEKPELIIDLSTLTGAARIAVGTDLAAMFTNNDELATALMQHAEKTQDPMWRLPLYAPYREYLNSTIADINNNASEPYAGAITAALFLKEFVPDDIPWVHFDFMAWNLRPRPGKPQGGEAQALRALFSYLKQRFQH